MSAGSKSGVNCILTLSTLKISAIVLIIRVLANPGTPISDVLSPTITQFSETSSFGGGQNTPNNGCAVKIKKQSSATDNEHKFLR